MYLSTAKVDGLRVLVTRDGDGPTQVLTRHMQAVDNVPPPTTLSPDTELDCEFLAPWFLVFDASRIQGTDVRDMPYVERYRRLVAYLRERAVFDMVVPKRMVSLESLHHLLNTLGTTTDLLLQTTLSDCVHADWSEAVHAQVLPVDGLVFMHCQATYDFKSPALFPLLKWKCAPTLDVSVCTRDLVRGLNIPAYYWEYSHRLQRSQRRTLPFRCHGRLNVQGQGRFVVVECLCDGTLIRERPDKTRTNSARTIWDTIWLARENIQLLDILRVCYHKDLHTHWIDTSLQTSFGELEVRYTTTLEGIIAVGAHLEKTTAYKTRHTTHTVDYLCGLYRVTQQEDGTYTCVHKERVCHFIEEGFKYHYSYEHPIPCPRSFRLDCVHERHKQRTRYVVLINGGKVAVDCTTINGTLQPTYEVEVELLAGRLHHVTSVATYLSSLFHSLTAVQE